ncbi:hypothetical protein EI94DRAFT_1704767 [Lactarius quietus]|nr:hypothetical protein EI94DRAFT_1704767 [Lactarius quietus]
MDFQATVLWSEFPSGFNSRQLSEHSRLVTTVATTDHTASSESQLLLTPMRSPSDGVQCCISDIEASNSAYHESVGKLPRYNEHMPSMDIIKVNSTCGQLPVSIGCSSNKATENYTEHDEYDMPVAQDEDVNVEMQTWLPSCNHDNDPDKVSNADSDEVHEVKVETGIQVSIASKGAHVTKKATNKDLPAGSMVKALEIIWKHVYTKYVHFNISPIISMMTHERAKNGRDKRLIQLVVIVKKTKLEASSSTVLAYIQTVTFASEMLEHYWFLYLDSTSKDPLDWTGMWHSPLFLQVFISQLNTTTSHIPCITELGSETQFYDGAMALAAAAVECTLTLIVNGEIDIKLIIEDRESMGSKHKHKSSKTSVWKVKHPNGPPQPFLDTL